MHLVLITMLYQNKEQTIMDIKFCLERISEQDLDTEIKLFLRRKEDPI